MNQDVLYTGEDISLNGVIFNSIDTLPDGSPGCAWLIEDIEGWWEHADLELFEDVRTPYEDGNYYSSGRYNAREITIVGRIIPPPGATTIRQPEPFIVQARKALNKAASLVRNIGVLQINESDAPKIAYVQISEKPLTRFNTISNHLEFSISLRASDPRKYSAELRTVSIPIPTAAEGRVYARGFPETYGAEGTGGIEYVPNLGEYETPAKMRVHGPVSDPVIKHHETGSELRFDVSIGLGDWLDVDLQARTALLESGTSARSALLPGSKWFQLAPGVNTIAYTGTQTLKPQTGSTPQLTNLMLNPEFEDANVAANTVSGTLFSGGPGVNWELSDTNASGPQETSAIQVRKITSSTVTIHPGGATGYAATVTPSTVYNASIYVKPSQPSTVRLQFKNNGDGNATVANSSDFALYPDVWTRIDSTFTTTASQTQASVALAWVDTDTDVYMFVTGVQLTESATLWPLITGNLPYCSWNGTPGAATSTRIPINADYVPLSVVELSYRDAWIY